MKRLRLTAWLAGAVALLIVVPVAAGGGSGPITVAPDDALAVLQSRGIAVPAQSCLAKPHRPGCPPVSEVVIQPQAVGGGDVQYVPSDAAPTSGAAQEKVNGVMRAYAYASGCYFNVTTPVVYYTASSTAKNMCSQIGVTDQETWGQVSRWQNGSWATMADCYRNSPLDGLQQCTSTYDCLHPTETFKYTGFVNAYAVVGGVGYFGSGQSGTTTSYCY
jgi:hypothetical protein